MMVAVIGLSLSVSHVQVPELAIGSGVNEHSQCTRVAMIMGGNETGTQQSVNNHSRNAAYSTTINRTKISTTMPYPR